MKCLLTDDVVQKRFDEFNIKLLSKYKGQKTIVTCKCFCGNIFEAKPYNVFRGHTKSCGCYSTYFGTQRKDLTGQRFGKLIALEISRISDKKNVFWKCKCDCGNFTEVLAGALNNKKPHTQSCGCLMYQYNKGNLNYMWKGCGEISARYWKNVKSNSTKRNINFDIDLEFAWNLFEKQNRICCLSGEFLSFGDSSKSMASTTASLDRIDSNLGYIQSNVCWVHKTVNKMKMNLSNDDLLYWCNLVVNPIENKSNSCHCNVREKLKSWGGHGNITKSFWEHIKDNANIRGLCFGITIEEAWELFLKQNGRCTITGVELDLFPNKKITASLDRINNKDGYNLLNCQWVHKVINAKLKQTLSQDEMLKWCKKIIEKGNNESTKNNT